MSIDLEKVDQRHQSMEKTREKPWLAKFLAKLNDIGTVSDKEKIFFTQNLQVMIRSGLPLDRSLKTLAEQVSNKKFKKIIADLAASTEKGLAFTDSLSKYEQVFGHLFISMVQAGEISGKLEDVLKQIYLQIKKAHELKSRIIGAMIYPVIVITAMVLIGIGMMIFVVPKITAIFVEMKAELPLPTKVLIGISNFILNNGLLTGLAAILFIGLIIYTIKNEKTKYYYHYLFLKTPILGGIVKKINIAKFARTLSSLLKTDISLVKSFEITAQILGNSLYRRSLLSSLNELKEGVGLTQVLQKYPNLYPPVIIQMVAAGEETGRVDEILTDLADFHEDEIDQIMKTLPTVIEPVLLLLLGVGVGAMAVAIIMPMYSLTEHIS
ncbi:MAG: type II secretion system F family protein [Candidatus Komeilibacteria bacterium]|nr:type II secretion system F family protein [Candidatus Komeilibacteria bacterium]